MTNRAQLAALEPFLEAAANMDGDEPDAMSLMSLKPRAIEKLVGEVNEDELAVRIIETMGQCKRVAGIDPTTVLNTQTPADVAESARSAARAAIVYMAECFRNTVRLT